MIQIDKDKFSCNCCFSEDNVMSISFLNNMKNGISVCLCEKCRKNLYEMLNGEFGSDKEWVSVNDRPPEPEPLCWSGEVGVCIPLCVEIVVDIQIGGGN